MTSDTLESKLDKNTSRVIIRLAVESDLPFLADIEASASEVFQSIPDLSFISADEPLSICTLRSFLSLNHLWVATIHGESNKPVAFLAARCIDAAMPENECQGSRHRHLYIVECSVHSSFQRQGIARRLFSAVEEYARRGIEGFGWLTLVTFLDIHWNGGFYRRLGFEEVDAKTMGDEYVSILREEADHWKGHWNTEKWRRGVMALKL